MDIILIIISLGVLIGSNYGSYKIGRQEGLRSGAENTIDVLHENKVISFDNKGNIIPNPFFKV
tara:strand:+ start:498 stop:686 length:189 start_codon:yes stop_codon:yes gene_type:complete